MPSCRPRRCSALSTRTIRDTAREQGARRSGGDRPRYAGGARDLQALKDPCSRPSQRLSHAWQPPGIRRAAGKPETLALILEVACAVAACGSRCTTMGQDRTSGGSRRRHGRAGSRADEAADPKRSCASSSSRVSPRRRPSIPSSGRGYGLSVAADAARSLQGSVRLEPRSPEGTSLVFSLPLSAARRSLLLVEAGGHTCALPSRRLVGSSGFRAPIFPSPWGACCFRPRSRARTPCPCPTSPPCSGRRANPMRATRAIVLRRSMDARHRRRPPERRALAPRAACARSRRRFRPDCGDGHPARRQARPRA